MLYRCDRNSATSQCQRGGGVLIGVKINLKSTTVSFTEADMLEQTAVRIEMKDGNIFICAVYLPPNSDPVLYERHAACTQQLSLLAKDRDKTIVLGDYNLPHLRWDYDDEMNCFLPMNASAESELTLVQSLLMTGLQQQNYCVNDNGRLLDLVFTSSTACVEIFEPPIPLLRIDRHHKPIVLKLNAENIYEEEKDERFDFRLCDMSLVNGLIQQIDWSQLLEIGSVDDAVTRFYDELYQIFRANVPLRKGKRKFHNKQPWWNGQLRNLRNRLRKARKRYFRCRSESRKIEMREIEAQFNSLNASSFRDYIHRIEDNVRADPKSFWTYVKDRQAVKGIPQNMRYQGLDATTPQETANMFSSFFQSVSSNNSPPLSETYLSSIPRYDVNVLQMNFSPHEVQLKLQSIDGSKGPGPDQLPPFFVKQCADALAYPFGAINDCRPSEVHVCLL
ncbi:uncharacterized protein LOC128736071 [Sabethes cyaneus]|uniref:uncharacterized protein LOC128736071 n=1 Tax=Sabethes cyaneus TaxID=53552 RepID=UPI00237D7D8E|nr:uncharacterized protein LOC128736071 [Sabethes cyaneus]